MAKKMVYKLEFLEPALPSPEEAINQLQSVLLSAVARTRKTKRSIGVVSFTSEKGSVRYRIYPYSQASMNGIKDCKVGERVRYLGSTDRHRLFESDHPLPFHPQSHFKDEYAALPVVREWEIKKFGKPFAEFCAEMEQQ